MYRWTSRTSRAAGRQRVDGRDGGAAAGLLPRARTASRSSADGVRRRGAGPSQYAPVRHHPGLSTSGSAKLNGDTATSSGAPSGIEPNAGTAAVVGVMPRESVSSRPGAGGEPDWDLERVRRFLVWRRAGTSRGRPNGAGNAVARLRGDAPWDARRGIAELVAPRQGRRGPIRRSRVVERRRRAGARRPQSRGPATTGAAVPNAWPSCFSSPASTWPACF